MNDRPQPHLSSAEQERAEGIERLATGGAGGIAELIAQLTEPSWTLRRAVVAALARLGDAAVEPVVQVLRAGRDDETRIAAAVDVLAASEGAAVDEAVLALTTSPNPAVVADAAQILGRRRSAAAIAPLAELTRHRDDNVAVAAIEALGRIGGRAVVDSLIAAARSGSFFRTFPAIDVLGRSGDPRAVAPLAALLVDSRYAHEATRALGYTGDKAAVAPLAEMLSRPSDTVVRLAALALSDLADRHIERYGAAPSIRPSLPRGAAERLTRALAGATPAEQIAVSRVLGELDDDVAAASLLRLLDAPAPVAAAAGDALKKLGQKAQDELLEALRRGDSARRRALLPLIGARAAALPAILLCLSDPDAAVRAAACDSIARIGDASAARPLFALLADKNPRVVHAAVGAVQSLGSAETEALTLAAARSDSAQVRRAALRIIGYFGYRSALDLLLAAIAGTDERLRDGAIAGLPFLEDPLARTALLAAARHESASARAAAMRALGQCPPAPDVTSCLREHLRDPDAWVRYYACQSLGKLACADAAEEVAALLEDDAGQVRVAAVEALSHLPGALAFDALCKAAGAADVDMRRAALIGLGLRGVSAALPLLLAAASSSEAPTRLVAVSAIAGLDAPEVVPALSRAAFDADEGVRTAAVGFLASRPTAEATRALIDLVLSGPPDDRFLAALSVPSGTRIQGILAALQSADDELAPRLTSALARMRRADATTALFQALSLPNVPARKAAAATLGAIGTPAADEKLRIAATSDEDAAVRSIAALALSR